MSKYRVIQADESGWVSVFGPDNRLVISNLTNLEQAKVWIKRDRARSRLPVVPPGIVIYEEEA